MDIFYTKIYNYIGDNAKKQEIIAKTADKLGMREFSLFRYPDSCDSDKDLFNRAEGIYSSFTNEATLIFQYPSMVSARYDKEISKHLRLYYNSKLIILFENWGYEVDPQNYPNIDEEIEILNSADLLILPSESTLNDLIAKGLKESMPIVYLDFWDFPKGIHFYDFGNLNVPYAFLSDGDSYKAGYYISNNVPVIVSNNSPIASFVKEKHIGYISDDNNVTENMKTILADDSTKFAVKAVKDLVDAGYFTLRALSEAIQKVVINTIK